MTLNPIAAHAVQPLAHFHAKVTELQSEAATQHIEHRARWNAAVQATSSAWRESFGYKHGPIMDHHMVKREVHEMLAKVIDGRLMTLFAPLFVTAESIERSILIISILASPSGDGPERYAPKNDDRQRIAVR